MRAFFIGLSLIVALSLRAQTKIEVNNFNHELLNDLVLTKINHIRDSLRVGSLLEDQLLKNAAAIQSDYITDIGKLTHYHKKKKYHLVKDRVESLNGDYSILLENMAMFSIFSNVKISGTNRVVNITTYEELANEFVKGWVKSSGHFRNIKNSKVNYSGIAIRIKPSKNEVYIVHVFGRKPFETSVVPVPDDTYGIHNVSNTAEFKACTEFDNFFAQLPSEVGFGVRLDSATKEVYLIMTDADYYPDYFTSSKDGFALDILRKQQFPCTGPNQINDDPMYNGTLLPPIYKSEVENLTSIDENGWTFTPLGKVPESIREEDLEFNVIFLKKNTQCLYFSLYDLAVNEWELLPMPLYSNFNQTSDANNDSIQEILKEKKLHFTIPFEKNKAKYNKEDIQPIYDSLSLNDYNITSIEIDAYASIEGSSEHNLELQQLRAQSIINVLQEHQLMEINQDVHTAENWVEFLNDIKDTKYSYLANKSKQEIKNEMEKLSSQQDVEDILKRHRKAMLTMYLEKKELQHMTNSIDASSVFNDAIKNKDRNKAENLQLMIFANIQNKRLPFEVLDSMNIPKDSSYAQLQFSEVVFKYQIDSLNEQQAIEQMLDIPILQNNIALVYNLSTLLLRKWQIAPDTIDANKVYSKLVELKKYNNLSPKKYYSLMINFYMLLSDIQLSQRNYDGLHESMDFIKENYKHLELNEEGVLNIAEFMAQHGGDKFAKKILIPYAENLQASEDLLFYFLNLTIIDNKLTRKSNYRNIMLNAYNRNPQRFCKLFDTFGKGGITFQLLENDYLKKTYCENCGF